MKLLIAARAFGVLGGCSWVARYALDQLDVGSQTLLDALGWVGLGLLFLAMVGLGTDLVGKGALWLQALVAVAFPLLVWLVLETIDPGFDPALVDAVFGAVILVISVVQLRRGQPEARPTKRPHGSHSR